MNTARDPDAFRAYLSDRAEDLQFSQKSVPVFLRHICRSLGVAIKRSSSVAQGKAYLNWDRSKKAEPVIVLPEFGNPTWDRFCAAHELAHFFLISQFDWIPSSKSTYWETEEICDEFARSLLIPSSLLAEIRNDESNFAIIQKTRHLSRVAKVPWSQFVIALSRTFPMAFFRGTMVGDRSSCKLTVSTLPDYQGRFSKIRETSPITRKLGAAALQAWQDRAEVYLDAHVGEFEGSRVHEILLDMGVTTVGIMIEPSRHDVFIVVRPPHA